MPDSADHRVEVFRLANARRAAGLPSWDRTLDVSDVFHNDEMSFPQRRDAIVARIRASGWLETAQPKLWNVLDCLAMASSTAEFDEFWDELYDHADYDRVWVKTQ